ncbi:unnamed protein product, partial [Leptidea sinapis]
SPVSSAVTSSIVHLQLTGLPTTKSSSIPNAKFGQMRSKLTAHLSLSVCQGIAPGEPTRSRVGKIGGPKGKP